MVQLAHDRVGCTAELSGHALPSTSKWERGGAHRRADGGGGASCVVSVQRTACVACQMEATVPIVSIDWTPEERAKVEEGIARYPAESKRCAALARIIYRLALPKDEQTQGLQLYAMPPARYLELKRDSPRVWDSHTLVETTGHRADALTGADGCASEEYLEQHFEYHRQIHSRKIDVFTVDPWIEEEEGGAS